MVVDAKKFNLDKNRLPKKRQTLLFSATMTDSLKELEQIAMNKPFFWQDELVLVSQY